VVSDMSTYATVEEERKRLIENLDFALNQLYVVRTSLNNRIAKLERDRVHQQKMLNDGK
jgi:hypothetical protein